MKLLDAFTWAVIIILWYQTWRAYSIYQRVKKYLALGSKIDEALQAAGKDQERLQEALTEMRRALKKIEEA